MKVTKPQLESLRTLKWHGGAVMTSEWTNGSGRYTTKKTVPPFCERIERNQLKGWIKENGEWIWSNRKYPKRIRRMFEKNPRCQAIVAIVDMRTVNKLLK